MDKKTKEKLIVDLHLELIKLRYDHLERIVRNVLLFSMTIVAVIIAAMFNGLPMKAGMYMVLIFGILICLILMPVAKRSDDATLKEIPDLIEKVQKGKLE